MQHSTHHYAVNQRSVLNTSHYRDILYVLQFEKPEFALFLGRFENLKLRIYIQGPLVRNQLP